MNRVVHFEIHADDPQRAADFYTSVFDWKFDKWDKSDQEYWLITTGSKEVPGINGGLVRRQGSVTGEYIMAFVCTIDVEDIDSAIKKVNEKGGMLVVPKNGVPQMGWLCYCKDTEGNIFGLMQSDTNAK